MIRLGTFGLIAAAALAGVLSAAAFTQLKSSLSTDSGVNLHAFLHEKVQLDAAERAGLDAKEAAYNAQRLAIEERLKAANGKLAAAIQADPRWSPEVEAATREVEEAAAALQRATLVHIFEMRDGLHEKDRSAYDRILIEALKRGAK